MSVSQEIEKMAKPHKKPKSDASPPDPKVVELRIDWHYPEGMTSKFANHMVVQRDENEVFLSFFELQPPVILSADDAKRLSGNASSVRATCVAKIAISKSRYEVFVKAIQGKQIEGTEIQATPDDSSGPTTGKNGKGE